MDRAAGVRGEAQCGERVVFVALREVCPLPTHLSGSSSLPSFASAPSCVLGGGDQGFLGQLCMRARMGTAVRWPSYTPVTCMLIPAVIARLAALLCMFTPPCDPGAVSVPSHSKRPLLSLWREGRRVVCPAGGQ